jgi:hypothetical protein
MLTAGQIFLAGSEASSIDFPQRQKRIPVAENPFHYVEQTRLCFSWRWKHVYNFAFAFFGREEHGSRNRCKQGVIPAHVHTYTCMVAGAALTHDDVAWDYDFATKFLDAEALGM